MSTITMFGCGAQVRNEPQIRLIAFAERPASEQSGPTVLQVYIINDTPAIRWILNDLDSINIPRGIPQGSEPVPDADLMHVDFGVSGSGRFLRVAPGQCVKVSLLLREQELALIEQVKQIKAPLKLRDSADDKGEETTVLVSGRVYGTTQ